MTSGTVSRLSISGDSLGSKPVPLGAEKLFIEAYLIARAHFGEINIVTLNKTSLKEPSAYRELDCKL